MEECKSCKFFRSNFFESPSGQCRRNAPSVLNSNNRWPEVEFDEWCGEYKPKETKESEGA